MTTVAARRRVPLAVPVATGLAWGLALAAQFSGNADALHHDALVGGHVLLAVPVFVLAWQVMIAAMMLPSSLPLIRLFTVAARRQPRPGLAITAFLGGYAVVWTGFGLVAFAGDVGVHEAVERSAWLEANGGLISAGALALAGAFQFSSLKKRCLAQCRQPGGFLRAHYDRGVRGGFRVGGAHGLFCLGCCWALMLLMFAVGVANLLWMAALTLLMVYEKTGRHATTVSRIAGVALLVSAAAVAAGNI